MDVVQKFLLVDKIYPEMSSYGLDYVRFAEVLGGIVNLITRIHIILYKEQWTMLMRPGGYSIKGSFDVSLCITRLGCQRNADIINK
jgi:hypothetical protein